MRDDDFEWDDDKARLNLAKHGVPFEAARDAFRDPFALEWEDDRDFGEPRFILVGQVEGRVLFVAYTTRGDRVRIISARMAEPFERRRYHDAD